MLITRRSWVRSPLEPSCIIFETDIHGFVTWKSNFAILAVVKWINCSLGSLSTFRYSVFRRFGQVKFANFVTALAASKKLMFTTKMVRSDLKIITSNCLSKYVTHTVPKHYYEPLKALSSKVKLLIYPVQDDSELFNLFNFFCFNQQINQLYGKRFEPTTIAFA